MSGCFGHHFPKGPASPIIKAPPALISHIVLITLKDPIDLEAIRWAADFSLGTIPSVATYACGSHHETGRSTVLNDYDLAIYLGFASQEDLDAYVTHPQHVGFVERWDPKVELWRVYDMLDEPNTLPLPARICVPDRRKFLGIF